MMKSRPCAGVLFMGICALGQKLFGLVNIISQNGFDERHRKDSLLDLPG
jgi:hypothetical protein